MTFGVLVLSLFMAAAGQATPTQATQDDTKKELDRLQGQWAVTSFNGEAIPAEAKAFLVFTASKYEQWTGDTVDERGTIKLDVKAKPMAIDLIITEGTDAGKTQLCVYEIKDDVMTLTLATPGETQRPASLTQGALTAVFKKVK